MMKFAHALLTLVATVLLLFGRCVDSFAVASTPKASANELTEAVPISLLSYDGGGLKGIMSARMLALSLQRIMQQKDANDWTENLASYVDTFKDSFPVMWNIWAHRMNSIGIAPQVKMPDGSKKQNWMDFSFDGGNEQKMIEAMLKVDLAYEYYLAYVLSVSGTSTGGLLTLGTMLRMSLTQLAALYMDPDTGKLIFPKTLNPFRIGGWLQAKYTQKGVNTMLDNIIKNVAPYTGKDPPTVSDLEYVAAADNYNACLKTRLRGAGIHELEKNRLKETLKDAQKEYPDKFGTDDGWVDEQLSQYEACVKKASDYLENAMVKRFKKIDGEENTQSLEKLGLKEPSSRYDDTFFSTRFLVTSRCANNGKAVIFDTHEPIEEGKPMTARGALMFGDEILDVSNIKFADVGLATSAAPYFFPAHQIGKFYMHDGGVMANDPGLLNLCISYRRFGESVLEGVSYPVFELLRVGCGKEEEYLTRPIGQFEPQGAFVVGKLADIFMSSDADRTDLLASMIAKTYILEETKLDAVVPTGKEDDHALPMDQVSTVNLINALFARIEPRLAHTIVIPEDELDLTVTTVEDLTDTILEGADFLIKSESDWDEKGIPAGSAAEVMMLMRGVAAAAVDKE